MASTETGAPSGEVSRGDPACFMKYCGIKRPDVELSDPNVNRLPFALVRLLIGRRPLLPLAMNTLVKRASMSRCARTLAPGVWRRA